MLIVVCCYCTRKLKRLRREFLLSDASVNENPHRNSDGNGTLVRSFPSPLQLESFTRGKTESPYDVPDQQEIEISYVSVIDGTDPEPQYTALDRNRVTDNPENEPNDSQSPPFYSNASELNLVDTNPYQKLMFVEGDKDQHYTSLAHKSEEEKTEESEAVSKHT